MLSRLQHMSMRHVVLAGVLIVLVAIITIGVFRPTYQPPRQTSPVPSSSTPHPRTPTATLQATAPVNELGINTDGLDEKVYLIEEALSMPNGTARDQKIRPLSTEEGFASTQQTSLGPPSNAEQAAEGIKFNAIRGCVECIQIEPLDKSTLSVFSQIQVQSFREGKLINTVTHERITMWTNKSGEWKFAGTQTE